MHIVSKSRIMQDVVHGLAHESFHHSDAGLFDITLMRQTALDGKFGELYQNELYPNRGDLVQFLREFRDWDPNRVWELLVDSKAPWEEPFVSILMPDGTNLFCDGTHRLMARWALRCPNFLFWTVPLKQAIRPSGDLNTNPSLDWGKLDFRTLQKRK